MAGMSNDMNTVWTISKRFDYIVYLDDKHRLYAIQYESEQEFERDIAFIRKKNQEGRILDFGVYSAFPSGEHALRMAASYLSETPENMAPIHKLQYSR